MEKHNTHLLSEQSNENQNHGYKYDNFGNVIADSVDDLIYDKFVDIKERQRYKNLETRNLIKNIINKEFSSSDNSQRNSKIMGNRKGSMKEKKNEEKKDKGQSITKNKSRKTVVKKENQIEIYKKRKKN